MREYAYTAKFEIETEGAIQFIEDNTIEYYGFEADCEELIEENKIDLIKTMVKKYYTNYCTQYTTFHKVLTLEQQKEIIDITIEEILKGHSVQIPLDLEINEDED